VNLQLEYGEYDSVKHYRKITSVVSISYIVQTLIVEIYRQSGINQERRENRSMNDNPISNYNLASTYSLSTNAARNLSNSTISVPMMEAITPRWLLNFLPWVPVEAGVYRVNKMKKYPREANNAGGETSEKLPELCDAQLGEHQIPQSFPDYDDKPREYILNLVQTVLRVNDQVAEIFNSPINQLEQQMRLTVETMKENQEWEVINNGEFGLLHSVAPSMRVQSRNGAPTPDDLDELLARVWKKPAFFLAHPRAIAAFGRECTRRGVPPATINLHGSPFLTWRGVPILPSDKLTVDGKSTNAGSPGKTNILLMRVGEANQGVIGLHQPGLPDESKTPSLSVRFVGIDSEGVSYYLLSLYYGVAVLADDALGMLENVEVGLYHDYK